MPVVRGAGLAAEFFSQASIVLLEIFNPHPCAGGRRVVDMEGTGDPRVDLGAAPGPSDITGIRRRTGHKRIAAEIKTVFGNFHFVLDGLELQGIRSDDGPVFSGGKFFNRNLDLVDLAAGVISEKHILFMVFVIRGANLTAILGCQKDVAGVVIHSHACAKITYVVEMQMSAQGRSKLAIL